MKRILLSMILLLTVMTAFAQKCPGRNGESKRIINGSDCIVLEQGVFRCDSLANGYVRYMDPQRNTLCVLAFENKIYKGEWDPITKTMKKPAGDPTYNKDEEGTYQDGVLWTGKKLILDKNGIVLRILLFENGHLMGEAQ